MRRSLLLSLGVLLLVGVSVAATTPAGASHAREVTVDGTVTGIDDTPADDAVVLVGEDSTLTRFSPDELRELATGDPRNLTVVAVGADGRFEATLDSRRAEAAVAVSDSGVSDLVYVRGENATLAMRLYETRPQTVHEHLGVVTTDERRAELYVNLRNSGDAAIENLSVGVVSLPDGWSVTEVETAGDYRPDDRTLVWPSVAPGAEIDTTVVLTVPDGTPVGQYTVELRAESDTHLVSAGPATVEVRPADTPTPTPAPGPDGDEAPPATESTENSPLPTERTTVTTPPSTTTSAPGFGPAATATALALVAALFVRSG